MMNILQRRDGSPTGAAEKARVETLERRDLMSAASQAASIRAPHSGPEFVYVESNNPQPGQNAVLAFRRNHADGSLRKSGGF